MDIDLHFGDGTAKILNKQSWVTVVNIQDQSRSLYLQTWEEAMRTCQVDLIGISAGFDNHAADWGGFLKTEDYEEIGYRSGRLPISIMATVSLCWKGDTMMRYSTKMCWP